MKKKKQELVLHEGQNLQLPGFELTRTGLKTLGDPSFEEWQKAGRSFEYFAGAVHWWIGDWLLAGADRYEHGQYDEAVKNLPFEYDTLRADKWVAEVFEFVRRRTNLTWGHHREVASLTSEDQDYWLDEAEGKGWTQKELRQQIRLASPKEIPALPNGRYQILLADPPWEYGDKLIEGYGAAEHHYPSLSTDQLCELIDTEGRRVQDLSGDHAILFLWVTVPLLPDGL
jgi:hypothetical protein